MRTGAQPVLVQVSSAARNPGSCFGVITNGVDALSDVDDRHIDRLVRRAVRGDAQAFGRIYDAYVDRVYGFVRARVSNPHDAEDITEVVFMKAFSAITSYDRRGLPFGAWLFRIARNATVDHLRRHGREPEPVEDVEVFTEPAPVMVDEQVAARLDAEALRRMVAQLTEDQAAVIACRFFWDMDIRQTAKVLDRTPGAVKALQHRAMAALAAMLEELSGDE